MVQERDNWGGAEKENKPKSQRSTHVVGDMALSNGA
jgi:hypothetical protein